MKQRIKSKLSQKNCSNAFFLLSFCEIIFVTTFWSFLFVNIEFVELYFSINVYLFSEQLHPKKKQFTKMVLLFAKHRVTGQTIKNWLAFYYVIHQPVFFSSSFEFCWNTLTQQQQQQNEFTKIQSPEFIKKSKNLWINNNWCHKFTSSYVFDNVIGWSFSFEMESESELFTLLSMLVHCVNKIHGKKINARKKSCQSFYHHHHHKNSDLVIVFY